MPEARLNAEVTSLTSAGFQICKFKLVQAWLRSDLSAMRAALHAARAAHFGGRAHARGTTDVEDLVVVPARAGVPMGGAVEDGVRLAVHEVLLQASPCRWPLPP